MRTIQTPAPHNDTFGQPQRIWLEEPVLVYASREEAELAVERYGPARVLDIQGLRSWWAGQGFAR